LDRRESIQRIAAGTVTLFLVPVAITSCEDDGPDPDNSKNPDSNKLTVDLTNSKYSALGSAGGSVSEGGIIIINTGDGFIALSSVCTHQGCQVTYNHSNQNLPCPCHGSVFATSGSVLQGPANSPLKKYEINQDGDLLIIAP